MCVCERERERDKRKGEGEGERERERVREPLREGKWKKRVKNLCRWGWEKVREGGKRVKEKFEERESRGILAYSSILSLIKITHSLSLSF
jgi:hypothetical protein